MWVALSVPSSPNYRIPLLLPQICLHSVPAATGHLHHLPEVAPSTTGTKIPRHEPSLQGIQENSDPRVNCKLQKRMRTSPRQVLAPQWGETIAEGRGLGCPETQTHRLHCRVAITASPMVQEPAHSQDEQPSQKPSISLFWKEGGVRGTNI